jgi:hypothetical protein
MTYEKEKVVTSVTADDISQRAILKGIFGYFANDVESLQKAVVYEKTSGRCYYGRLTQVRNRDKKDRFVMDKGELIFNLFYPTDTLLNTARY